jgi:cytochrome P450
MGVSLFVPGASLINLFPILAYIPPWFPGASSHKVAAEVRRLTDEVIRFPMDWAKMRMSEGTAVPSLVTNFLEKKNTVGASAQEEMVIENIAYTVYGAASDTTISASGSFFYFMAVNPGVQEKAQREIDRVIGRNRLPNFSDRPNMPYLEAIYREVLRSRPPAQLGGPHSLMEDDHYKGYFIPKGTIVLSNIWAMTHDESVYSEPFAFKPERFLDENGELNDDDRVLAYGFGRRVCVGKHVASATLWLTFTSILATFNIGKARDNSGKEIPISDEYEDFGLLLHKKHFECSIKPRSREHRQLIEEANVSNK